MNSATETDKQSKMESVLQLINSIKIQLDRKECDWDKCQEVCSMIIELVDKSENSLKENDNDNRNLAYGIEKLFHCATVWEENKKNFIIGLMAKLPFRIQQSTVLCLIETMESELNTELKEWYRHRNASMLIGWMLTEHGDSLEENLVDRIFDYLKKLVLQCKDSFIISNGLYAFALFPSSKLQSSIPHLMDTMELEFETGQNQWYKHRNMSMVIDFVLTRHRDSLDKLVIDRMLDYITKIIISTREKSLIEFGISAFLQFPQSQIESSMPILIDSIENELETEQIEWDKHQNMSEVIELAVKKHQNSLNETVIDRMLNYIIKIIFQSREKNLIVFGLSVFLQFPLCKIESSITLLIDLTENELETKQKEWRKDQNLSEEIQSVLPEHSDSQEQMEASIDRIFHNLTKPSHQWENDELISSRILASELLSKLRSSLSLLNDSMEADMKTLPNQWHKPQIMSLVIQSVLKKHQDLLSETVVDQMFAYLTKLIRQCEDGHLIANGLGAFMTFPLSKLESSLPLLIDMFEIELESEQKEWFKHRNMSCAIYLTLEKHRDSLHSTTIDGIFHYLTKLLQKCEDGNITLPAIIAFKLFPINSLECLLPLLIDSLEKELKSEQNQWFIHQNMSEAMQSVLQEHSALLSEAVVDLMFNYFTKLILECEDGKLISHAIEAFGLFPLSKLESSLPLLIDSIESELKTEQNEWYRHQNMSEAIQSVLEKHRDSLDKTLIDKIFDYLAKLISQCENEKLILHGIRAFKLFSLGKLEFSLPLLIDSMESEIKTEQNQWHKHRNMSLVIRDVLTEHRDLLNEFVIDKMLDYITKLIRKCEDGNMILHGINAFVLFKSSKYESSLSFLIDSIESELETEQNEWHKHRNMSWVIQKVLTEHIESLDETVIGQMFTYLTKLISQCEDGNIISHGIEAFKLIPYSKLESSLLLLIEALMKTEDNQWYKHQNIGRVFQLILMIHKDSFNNQDEAVIDQMFEYIAKLIQQCDGDLISYEIGTFHLFPISKLESSFPKLLVNMKRELETEHSEWFKHKNICAVIRSVLKKHHDSLNETVVDRMFNYLTKLLWQCEDENLISYGMGTFQLFPLGKLEFSLPLLINTMESELETEQSQWYRHENMCMVIQVLLIEHGNTLNETLVDQMFHYLSNLIQKCEDGDLILYGIGAFHLFPISKFESSFPKLLVTMESELETKRREWFKHKNMSEVIRSVLKQHQDSVNETVVDRMFNYLTKLIQKCEDGNLISYGIRAFKQFPLGKLNSSLPLLIDSMKSELETEQNQWYRHQNMSEVIEEVLQMHRDSLDKTVVNRMFSYLTKLIQQCEDGTLISNGIEAFRQFSFSKLESSLPHLINSMKSEFENEQTQWYKHDNMSRAIQCVLTEHMNSFDGTFVDLTFDYLTKFICLCEDGNLISYALGTFILFPLSKLKSSLPLYIDLLESELETEQNQWHIHQNMSWVIQEVLKKHMNSFDGIFFDRMFGYLTKLIRHCEEGKFISYALGAFRTFPISKLESSLPLLIDSMENELITDPNKWYRHQNMNMAIQYVLTEYVDLLDGTVVDRIFGYLTKLIRQCKDKDQISYALGASSLFSMSKVESSLPLLIDSMEAEMKSEQNQWYKHENMSLVIKSVLKKHRDLLNETVIDRIFNYLSKIIYQCEDGKLVPNGLDAFMTFPLSKLESSLSLLIDSMEAEMKSEQNQWYRHQNMCVVIHSVLTNHRDSLNPTVNDQMLHYLSNLIFQCEDGNLILHGAGAFITFPLSKLESSLPLLIDSMEAEMKSEQNQWYKHENMSMTIHSVLEKHRNSLDETVVERMFDYLAKLSYLCEEAKIVEYVIMSLSKHNPSRLKSMIIRLIHLDKSYLDCTMNESNLRSSPSFEMTIVDNLKSRKTDWKLDRNLSLLIKHLNFNNEFSDDKEIVSEIYNLMLKLLNQNINLELSTCAISALENINQSKFLTNENREKLIETVSKYAKFQTQYSIENYCTNDFDYMKYKFVWCAKWFLENVLNSNNISCNKPLLKISSDRLSAQNEYSFPSVRSSFAVQSGVYFYEVILLSDGLMQIGWATREARFGGGEGVGDDAHSIGIDASRSCIWHNKNSEGYRIEYLSKWEVGDVVGCLIDYENKRFAFYLNGRQFKCPGQIQFSSQPYFAGASLEKGQQCYFNFGQLPFKFPPNGIEFIDSHKSTNGNASKYHLMETCKVAENDKEYYWFKNTVNNQIDPFFYGTEQEKNDVIIQEFLEKEREIDLIKLDRYLINDHYRCLRFIQSVIEILGRNTEYFKVDIIASWIGKFIEQQFKPTPIKKLCELLYPYLQQNSSKNILRYRNTRIVLSNLIKLERVLNIFFVQYIRRETFDALTRTFSETSDEWAKLFALIGLEDLEMSKQEKDHIVNDEFVLNLADGWNEKTYKELIKKKSSFASYQVSFASQHLLAKLDPESGTNEIEDNKERLDINSKTNHLKLSSDLLSARSDFNRQNIKSQCSANSNVYYEVVLLTNGELDIGWTTKSEHSHKSICYDGYRQVIKHQNRSYPVSSVSRWKSGDIVGCLMDAENGKFRFYLNGRLINFPSNITFSTQLYHAFASLSTHQQCYFNFGQFEFKYAPKRFRFQSFCKEIE